MRKLVLVLLVIALVTIVAIVASCKSEQKTASASASTSAVCPVMGTPIPDTGKAAGKSVYKGKTYYFCCD
ncbi:MAG: hypothetical protein ACYC2Y_04815 [Armatimonadota bacterium]